MPRINPVVMDNLDPDTAEVLETVKTKLGALPNIFTTFAQSPVALNGYLQLSDTLSHGQLTSKQRELIAIAVAQQNQCGYCLSAHAAIGKGAGLENDDVMGARKGMASSPQNEAIVKFALQVVRTQGAVSDEDLTNIVKTCGHEGIALEIASNVALNIMTNYMNRLADTEIDFPNVDL